MHDPSLKMIGFHLWEFGERTLISHRELSKSKAPLNSYWHNGHVHLVKVKVALKSAQSVMLSPFVRHNCLFGVLIDWLILRNLLLGWHSIF